MHSKKLFSSIILLLFLPLAYLLLSQTVFAHRQGFFNPSYPPLELTAILQQPLLSAVDYQRIFLQTGLGSSAIDDLLQDESCGISQILDYQQSFFTPMTTSCHSLLGLLTKEDLLTNSAGLLINNPALVNPHPGDIIITLATHSFGWHHGHSGLIIDAQTVLESTCLGRDSILSPLTGWQHYGNYILLRVKNTTTETANLVAQYSQKHLLGKPYSLVAGLGKNTNDLATIEAAAMKEETNPSAEAEPQPGDLKLQCAYLVWFAWHTMGIDLDADGIKPVTPRDILFSPHLEVIQVFGLDPRLFVKSIGKQQSFAR